MICKFCNKKEAIDIEEYCHGCGEYPVCFDCLTDEECPWCTAEWNNCAASATAELNHENAKQEPTKGSDK